MSEDFSITSDYWRKLIGLDAQDQGDVFKKYRYPHRMLRPLFWWLFGLLARSYWRVSFSGIENIPKKPPYIVASNHASSLDYPVLAWPMGRRRNELYVLATKHFFDNPFSRFFMKIAANIDRIDTVDDFLPALKAAAKILRNGGSIFISPEGTRSTTGELLPFRPGVGILAVELKVPIVPVHIKGAHECFPPGSLFPRPGKINVTFGKPIYVDKYLPRLKTENAYYVYKEVTDELRKRVIELKDLRLQ